MKPDTEELRRTASQAGQSRFCPTAAMLLEKGHSSELRAHLESCALCRSRLTDADRLASEQAWEKLAELVNEPLLASAGTPEPLPCQIWTVAEKYGGWGEYDQYYHAPQVLVLGVFPYRVVRVAHISDFGELAARGDGLLFDEPSKGFAEMWNQYSLPVSWLDVCIGEISGRRMAALRLTEHLHEDPEEGSPLDIFRQQELYHSMHFSHGAMEEVMRLAEEWNCMEGGAKVHRLDEAARADCRKPSGPSATLLPFPPVLPTVRNVHQPMLYAEPEETAAEAAAAKPEFVCLEKELRVELKDGKAILTNEGNENLLVRFVDAEGFILPVEGSEGSDMAEVARATGRELPEFIEFGAKNVASFVLVKAGHEMTVYLNTEAVAEENGILIL